ncbi:MAG: sugar phosphate isomerase/epimerase [Patescibacteria group bacterium]|nr:sugar phosphate isomerase/epimerase [Patescibacteria group bacterium]
MTKNRISRRGALKTGAGLLAAGVSAPLFGRVGWAAEAKQIPISLQLYSIRGDCAQDFDKAVEAVAEMGYDGVEFAGYHKYSGNPEGLKKKLGDLGLKVAGTHIGTGSFAPDRIQQTIEFHQVLGCKFLIVPGDGAFCHPENSKKLAETFNKAAEILKPHGMYCGYHNHTQEFNTAPDTDKTWWDLFAERTVHDVVLQQDCGWTAHAGRDPVEYIHKYPGRTRITHFKPSVKSGDEGKKAFIGQDSVDWAAVITACREVGATEWITIEQETYPDGKSPLECTDISLKGLRRILAEMGS